MIRSLKPIRVLIVDDSPFIRMSLKAVLSKEPGIEVVDTAKDGKEGIMKLQTLKPDVVTMDVEMPVMNGLQALEEIMRWQPTPVIILSAVTTNGAKLTMKALELGAVEVVAKPSGRQGDDLTALSEDLTMKVKSAAGIDTSRLSKGWGTAQDILAVKKTTAPLKAAVAAMAPAVLPAQNGSYPAQRIEIVAIGTSTGGPTALQNVLTALPPDFPVPIIVAQHMPPGFTGPLASRLNSLSKITVKEVEDKEVLKPGTAYIGQSGKQFRIMRSKHEIIAHVTMESPIPTLYKPSLDVMFMSLAREVGGGVLGVVMTGMGNDGLQGMKELKAKGGFAIAEAEKTCVVYGMPRSIIEAGLADRIENLPDIAKSIIECVNRR